MWRNEALYRRIGIVPEREATYDVLSGRAFVLANAKLQRLPDPAAAANRALDLVEMSDAAGREISTYSKGMKQRIKMASALVHDPPLLMLDEPFNGMDPRQRLQLMALLTSMAEQGRTVLFSSHILEEVEEIAGTIEVMVAGRHAASGDFREIRRLMTERPHQYTVRSSDDRALAAALIADGCVSSVQLVGTAAAAGSAALHVEATDQGRFVHVLPVVARDARISVYEVTPADESLESVFSYLVAR